MLKHDFDYWGVDEMMLEPCCALKYYPEMEVCSKEQEGERRAKRRMQVRTRGCPHFFVYWIDCLLTESTYSKENVTRSFIQKQWM